MWTRALNARSEASLSEASLSEASSSAGLRNSFSNYFLDLFFDYPLGAVEAFLDAKRLRSEHFSTSRGFGASIFERFSTSGGFGASIFQHFRRLEASERAFSSIFDVWRLRSEHFRAFSMSGGSGARILEVSRGEQLRPRVPSHHGAKRSLRSF